MTQGPWRDRACLVMPVIVTALFALRKIDDWDTWWHLASGRWIAAHMAIPRADMLSHTVAGRPWIDVEWGFQALVYALHAAGGPALLCIASALGFASACALVMLLLVRRLPPAAAALIAAVVLLVAQERFTVRPEMISFALFAALLLILERGRAARGRGLWMLVPVMIVWVNAHGLFAVGYVAIACALAGALAGDLPLLPAAVRRGSSWDRPARGRLAVWSGLALVAGLLNPYGFRGLLLPLELFTLIKKPTPALQSIAEFRSPFAEGSFGTAMTLYKIALVVAIAIVVTALLRALLRPAGASQKGSSLSSPCDLGALALFAGLAALSVIARRNAALFAIGAAPLVATSIASLGSLASSAGPASLGGAMAASMSGRLRAVARMRDRLRAAARPAAYALLAAWAGLGALVITGSFYRWDRQPREFGIGILEGTFPVRAAAFARAAKLPGRLYNDLAAGGYLTWDEAIVQGGQGVFIDGRLELYDDLYQDYVASMYEPQQWESLTTRYGISTVILFHHWENRRLLIERLARDPAWPLVYADESAAIFVRAHGNEEALARASALQESANRATRAWLDRPAPGSGYPAGRIEGTRAFARLLATLGDAEGSAEQFTRLLALGVSKAEEIDVRLRLADLYAATSRSPMARAELQTILALDPSHAEARRRLADLR